MPDAPAVQTTKTNRAWLVKMVIFMVVLLGFGCWGLFDALHAYPARGEADATFRLKAYLEAARDAARLNGAGVAIADPSAELAALSTREADLRRNASDLTMSGRQAKADLARLEWLQSLKRLGTLSKAPSRLDIDRLDGQLADLTQQTRTMVQPSPLAAYDLPLQWAFVVVGFGLAAWLVVLIARVSGNKYRWDPSDHRLTLPGGVSLVPADVREFDKRKWHKFYVTLHLNDGRSIPLDLLRFVPLEDWVLAMEKVRFPEAAKPENPAEASVSPGAPPGASA